MRTGIVEHGTYRPEIDGLRAIAVTAVVLFHAFPTSFPGGFVGVDVFFVISGYLITGIICRDLEMGRFTFTGFYANRFRRIAPALTLVLIAAWVLGWFALLSEEYRNLGKHILAGATYTSNFALWTEANYFNTAASTKPLLHLWSLSIEEQFYLVWPCVLVCFYRRKKLLMTLIAGFFIASFSFDLINQKSLPTQVFYFLPWRFWELLMGCGLAVLRVPGLLKNERLPRFADFLCVGSIASIGILALWLPKVPYPGPWTLFPTSVAFTILLLGDSLEAKKSFTKRILASPFAVFVGRISYPLYLWHWPLLSFAHISGHGYTSVRLRFILIALSVLLAWLTFRFVETPVKKRLFRRRSFSFQSRAFVCLGLGMMVAMAFLGFCTLKNNGFPFRVREFDVAEKSLKRIPMDELVSRCQQEFPQDSITERCWTQEHPNAAILSDSHAGTLFRGIIENPPSSFRWMLFELDSCPPLDGVIVDGHDECSHFYSSAMKTLEARTEIKTIVLSIASRLLAAPAVFTAESQSQPNANEKLVFMGLSRTIERLQRAGKQVVFVIDNPAITESPELCIPRPIHFENPSMVNCSMNFEVFMKKTAEYRSLLKQLSEAFPKLLVFDPTSLLCDKRKCDVMNGGVSFYSYSDHLSDYSAQLVAKSLLSWLSSDDFKN